MKKDNKALNDLDQELNLFMHSQVPEVEPEDTDTIHPDYELPSENNSPPVDDFLLVANYYANDAPIPDAIQMLGNEDYFKKRGLISEDGIPMVANIQFKEPRPEAFDIGQPNDQPEIARALYLDNEAQNIFIHGQDILDIRGLTGKKKDNAVVALKEQTVAMLEQADPECFYIRGNVASSKNSKNPVTVKRINSKTGNEQEFTTFVASKTTREYIRDTKAQWLQNKVAFLNQTRKLPLPLKIEFTFIRDSLRAFDFINAAQILMDLMGEKNGYSWISDDESAIVVPIFNPVVYYHKQMAGVLIRVIK